MQVAAFFTGWLVFWMVVGTFVGIFGFGAPLAGTVYGFLFAVLATFAWPWIMPQFIDDWMDDSYAPTWQSEGRLPVLYLERANDVMSSSWQVWSKNFISRGAYPAVGAMANFGKEGRPEPVIAKMAQEQ